MKRAHIFISGRVQGVNFRRFVEKNAKKLNIKGFVRNLYSGERAGQVEAVFEGGDKEVEEMINLCKKGPILSKVENVEVIYEEYKNEFNDFVIK